MSQAKKQEIELHRNGFRFLTVIEPEQLIEILEILCDVPTEVTMFEDTEPRTTRHPIIENMITELQIRIIKGGDIYE